MVLLQPRLNVKISQKQILTPGLVQMVSVLALNKLELKDMIYEEMTQNPALEELESPIPLLDDVAARQEDRERAATATDSDAEPAETKDAFDEIDFGSFFQDYLDPGYRSPSAESVDKPSFENFLSRPQTLTDHLLWQLGSVPCRAAVREAAELVIGNLNEDGYLTASEDELMAVAEREVRQTSASDPEAPQSRVATEFAQQPEIHAPQEPQEEPATLDVAGSAETLPEMPAEAAAQLPESEALRSEQPAAATEASGLAFSREDIREAIGIVKGLDPVGVACRDLRECLLMQLQHHLQLLQDQLYKNGKNTEQVITDAIAVVDQHLHALQNKQYREIAKAIGRTVDDLMRAYEYIRTLDPKPGARYNQQEAQIVEPDVAFVKQGDEWYVLMNEDDVPQLRLNPAYKRLLVRDAAEKDVRNYVKERYKSAIQLIKNIEQRKQTILKVCYAIIGRQREFLEHGIDQLKPMMIKDVAEEVGVHPSTVSRAVAGKYVHTPQGVFELRYFFSESVQGPEGGGTPLLILKRRVKKLIEEEDPARPLTDEQITRILQSQGIQVTRRTVAKYREDMKIPSTHQRRVKT